MKLTDKQRRFCEEYLIDFNATQAAIRAGYSEKTAKSQGQRLLTNVDISAYIQKCRDQLSDKTEITAERVINELGKIAFHNPKMLYDDDGNIIPIQELPDEVAAALSEIKTKHYQSKVDKNMVLIETSYKIHSKNQALESLGKHFGIYEKDNRQKEQQSTVIILPSNNR